MTLSSSSRPLVSSVILYRPLVYFASNSLVDSLSRPSTMWQCTTCSLENHERLSHCDACGETRPPWTCDKCTLLNAEPAQTCDACHAPRPTHTSRPKQQQRTTPSSNTTPPPPKPVWPCPRCTLENSAHAAVCAACDAPRPPRPRMRPAEPLPPPPEPRPSVPPAARPAPSASDDSVDELYALLSTVQLERLAPTLAEHDVADVETLALLTEADYDRLGVSIGARRKLCGLLGGGAAEASAADADACHAPVVTAAAPAAAAAAPSAYAFDVDPSRMVARELEGIDAILAAPERPASPPLAAAAPAVVPRLHPPPRVRASGMLPEAREARPRSASVEAAGGTARADAAVAIGSIAPSPPTAAVPGDDEEWVSVHAGATDASGEGREQLLPPEARPRAASLGGLLATVGARGNAYSQLADDAPFKGT